MIKIIQVAEEELDRQRLEGTELRRVEGLGEDFNFDSSDFESGLNFKLRNFKESLLNC